jgi:Flavin reductase like domain
LDNTALLKAFEAGEIAGNDFPHRSHVRVAWELSRRYEPEEGLRRLIAGIQGIAVRAGQPTVYHETITRAWFELVSSADDLAEHPELFDKTLLGRYYTAGRLEAGRERWLEPDLHPLTLPPPQPAERNSLAFLEVMRNVPVRVAVLATCALGTVHAATISSLASLSREPALISVCLANDSRTLELVRAARAFDPDG